MKKLNLNQKKDSAKKSAKNNFKLVDPRGVEPLTSAM